MKKIVLVIFVFSFTNLFSQNFYSLIKSPKSLKPIKISRTTFSIPTYSNYAYSAILTQTSQVNITRVNNQVMFQAYIAQQRVSPIEVSGGYNYLRTVSQSLSGESEWHRINASDGYNGVHHIISKSALAVIYKQRNRLDNGLTYEDFTRNAPSAFHPFHNNNEFFDIFHNAERQILIYEKVGVIGVLEDYFERVNVLNRKYGLPEYSDDMIARSLLEAKFWAKIHGLVWER